MNRERKLVVVTGGASGIGEATARRFGQGGFHVVVADVNSERGKAVADEIRQAGGSADFLSVDVSSESAVQRFAAEVLERHGVPDALVNSGGILQNAVRLLEANVEELDRLYDINVRGTLLVSRAFGAGMCEAGRGAIINLCSMTTYRPSAQIGYAIGKAGLKMLTEVMAAEWGPSGVRVNAVAPGPIDTDLTATMDPADRQAFIDALPVGRFGRPEEIAATALLLASPDGGFFVGATLSPNGGDVMY
jgi:NAD(P)-dependent dehydrogenase (short-subunit alcohol dehydrogenase family)